MAEATEGLWGRRRNRGWRALKAWTVSAMQMWWPGSGEPGDHVRWPRPLDCGGNPGPPGELVDAEDGDDVLQLLVALQDLHDAAGDRRSARSPTTSGCRMVLVDASGSTAGKMPLANTSRRQVGRGVEVGEGGERRRVGVVVGGHVHGLHRGDRTALGRGDALLQLAHLVGQGGLVAHGRGHPAEQGRRPRSRPGRSGRCCR